MYLIIVLSGMSILDALYLHHDIIVHIPNYQQLLLVKCKVFSRKKVKPALLDKTTSSHLISVQFVVSEMSEKYQTISLDMDFALVVWYAGRFRAVDSCFSKPCNDMPE